MQLPHRARVATDWEAAWGRRVSLFGVRETHLAGLGGATGWLHTEPLGPAELRGHVVLVNFWTLTCINGCARSRTSAPGRGRTGPTGSS